MNALNDFNSIKVQLELTSGEKGIFICRFQFHKGTIRTRVKVEVFSFKWYFNSIKVQLERTQSLSYYLIDEFQFQKGTIRTKIYQDFYRNDQISIP